MMRAARYALVLVMLVAAASAAPPRWWESYRAGIQAAQSRDWTTAAQQMELAIAQRPNEALAAPAGRNQSIEYVPHFWLGVARFNLGDIDGATREWDISQSQGVIQRTQNYSVLQSYRAQARSQLDKKQNERSAGSRREADAALKRALGGRMNAMTAGADRLESYRAAGRRLQEAWDQFNSAESDPAAYKQATKLAGEAEAMFNASAEEARARKSARAATPPRTASRAQTAAPQAVPQQPPPQTAVAQPVQQTPAPAKEEGPAVAKIEVVAPVPEAVQPSNQLLVTRRALERLQANIRRARSKRPVDPQTSGFLSSAAASADRWSRELARPIDDDSAAEIENEIVALERNLAAFSKSADAPVVADKGGATLMNAYRAFAAGDLHASEAMLTSMIATRAEAEALLLRGCVRYTESVLQRDQSLAQAAERDFTAALRLKPRIALDPRHFSPKLIAAFDGAKAKQKR